MGSGVQAGKEGPRPQPTDPATRGPDTVVAEGTSVQVQGSPMLMARRSAEEQSGQPLGQGIGPGESLGLHSLEAPHLHTSERRGFPQNNIGGKPDRVISLRGP